MRFVISTNTDRLIHAVQIVNILFFVSIYSLNFCQNSVSLEGERTTQGMKSAFYNQFALAGILCLWFCANSVRANVYATDIRLNGSLNAGVVVPGKNLTISYILNDTATGGVWIRV